jgi:hypothetical protein
MTNKPPGSDIRNLWQTQPTEPLTMSIQQIRHKAEKFERNINFRNVVETIAAVCAMACAGWLAVVLDNTIVRIGLALIVVGALYMVRQLHRHGSAGTLSTDATALASMEFYQAELIRQRDLLRRVWSWYLGPLLPGAALLYLGVLMQRPDKALDIGLNGLVFALIFLAIGALNLYATKKLQEEVDELDSLKNGESS